MIKTILLTFCTALILFSCKKDEKSKTKTELLTIGTWHVSSYTVDPAIDWNGDGTDESDVYPIIDECIKDDRTTFFVNGTGELDEGATKCNDNDPQSVAITWSLDQTETQLQVQGVQYLLESLTENILTIKEIEVVSAITYTHTVSFSH